MNNTRRNHKQTNYKLLLFQFRESKYYPFFFHGCIIVLCILLITFIVIPLGNNLFAMNKQVDQERQRISVLSQNITYLSGLTDTEVEEKTMLANALFPQTKDFNGTIQALNASAATSSATIESFSFTLADTNAKPGITPQTDSLDVTVTLQGPTASIIDFIQALETKVPLMNVDNVEIKQNTATLVVQIAYKPYTEQKIDLTSTLLPLSASSISLYQQAEEWKNESLFTAPATSSATEVNNLPPF